MFDSRRGAAAADREDGNGYAETDPTGRYGRFDEVLGKGAMKTVYRAFDELNGIEVAWNQAKLCNVMRSADALQRMYSEVHLLSTLHHDSIIRFHASWVDIGKRTFNFITEMFTSGTLREYRQKYRRVDIRAVKNWARQILHGLVYLHGHDPPVIHRDLKCDNIFVNGHLGQVKIGDLGLAAVLRESQAAHSVIGTPEFMAPELYEEEYNELVDVYSFGMCVLEMLTSEYPYSECSNPAQIYKKVTSGKLPDAFYQIQDPEVKRFILRCLVTASMRASAKELLLDPFLLVEDHHIHRPINAAPKPKNFLSEGQILHSPEPRDRSGKTKRRTNMTITGKMNPEDHTIFLKVKIADKDGNVRNIYFPFDIVSDTPIDVANEMVKELEITDREPSEIAEVIDQEITTLVPGWKDPADDDQVHQDDEEEDDEPPPHHVYNYGEEEEEGLDPFYYLSSPTSSQSSAFGVVDSCQRSYGQANQASDWLRDLLPDDDDETCSMNSSRYSAVNYNSGNEQESNDHSLHQISHAEHLPKNQKSTRFCHPEGDASLIAKKFQRQCHMLPPECSQASTSRGGKRAADNRRLMRNRSMVDMRSQLLHRSLVEEVNKRMFKTIGAVENIGFQMPYDSSRKGRTSPLSRGDHRKQGQTWGRG